MKKFLVAASIALCLGLPAIPTMVSANQQASSEVQSTAPQISQITTSPSDQGLAVVIEGNGFGKDASLVQISINDNQTAVTIGKVKPHKIFATIAKDALCNGTLIVRVRVGSAISNPGAFDYSAGSPVINEVQPGHALPGDLVVVSTDNLSCAGGQVSFNGLPAESIYLQDKQLTVRVPYNLSPGAANLLLTSGGLTSQVSPFQVDTAPPPPPPPAPVDNKIKFQADGQPGSAGFSPMFDLTNTFNYLSVQTSLWDANFFGSHTAIIKAGWKTADGHDQVALLTINAAYSNSLLDTKGDWEKFIYMRVNFPLHPDQPYDPDANPFWWGASSIATENHPFGGLYYNSKAKATGGVDSFSMDTAIPGQSQCSMTMHLVSPDLGGYADYGKNYAQAGGGNMPKVMMVQVNLSAIQMSTPGPHLGTGDVTLTDESGFNPAVTSPAVKFDSNVITVKPNQPQL